MCARVAQLVRANVGRCGPNTRHMVPGLNFFFDKQSQFIKKRLKSPKVYKAYTRQQRPNKQKAKKQTTP